MKSIVPIQLINIGSSVPVDSFTTGTLGLFFRNSSLKLKGTIEKDIVLNRILEGLTSSYAIPLTITDDVITGFSKIKKTFESLNIKGDAIGQAVYDNDGLSIDIEITGSLGNGSYTNTDPVPDNFRGVESGETFQSESYYNMFTKILYPYQYPEFLTFSLDNYSNLEMGFALPLSMHFYWTASNTNNIQDISIIGYNTSLISIPNTGNYYKTFASAVTRTSLEGVGTRAWEIQGTNTKNILFIKTLTLRWDYKLYYGNNINTSLVESEIKNLTGVLKSSFKGTYYFPGSGYKYICWADEYGSPLSFKDEDTSFLVAMYEGYPYIDSNGFSYNLVQVTNSNNQTTNYRVYRTKNSVTNLKITIL